MCEKFYSELYKDIKKEDVWQLWSVPENWLKWHTGAKSCKLDGDFKPGNYIILNHSGVGVVKILITKIEKEKEFSCMATFFGAKVSYTRKIEENPEGLLLTYAIRITGFLKLWWYWKLKKGLFDRMPHDLNKLVEVLRQTS